MRYGFHSLEINL